MVLSDPQRAWETILGDKGANQQNWEDLEASQLAWVASQRIRRLVKGLKGQSEGMEVDCPAIVLVFCVG